MDDTSDYEFWLGEYTDGTVWTSLDMWDILVNIDDGNDRRLTRLMCKHTVDGYCCLVEGGNIIKNRVPMDEVVVLELLLRAQAVPGSSFKFKV